MKSKFLKEFKEFAMRGNVIDLAVGIVIGGAFGKIVSSLVADVIMPLVGMLLGGVNFTKLKIPLKHSIVNEAGQVVTPEVAITIGNFIQATFDFAIIAFAIFLFIKLINRLKTKREAAAPVTDVQLLTEIRDLLKKDLSKQ